MCELRGGEADCMKETGFLRRGGGRGGRMRDGLRSCNESTMGSHPIESAEEGFPSFLTGREGGRGRRVSTLGGCGVTVGSHWWLVSAGFWDGWMI